MIYGIRQFCNDTGFDFDETCQVLEDKCKTEFLQSLVCKYVRWPIFRNRWYRECLTNLQWEVLQNEDFSNISIVVYE